MKSKAFVFSTTGFLLVIPAIILAASFMSMLETGSTGVFIHVRADKTFSLFETAETDLDRAIDISARRAVLAAADYVLTYGGCLNSETYNHAPYGTGAIGAIKELMITGNLTSVKYGVFSSSLTPGATLEDWISAFPERAEALGFNVSLTISSSDLYITPVDDTWFYATLKVNASIENVGGNVTYNGTLPRTGNTTRLISGHGVNATIFNCIEAVENPPPDSTISSPSDLSTISCDTTEITGSAADDSGVIRVNVNISETWYEATLGNPGAASTSWSLNWTPGADGDYTICSHATDNNYTGQSTDYCITTTVSGCPVATCSIILDSSYTPYAFPTWGGNRYYRVRFRVLNNDPSDTVTIDEMTVAWSKSGVNMNRIRFGWSTRWTGCASNNTVEDISDISISSGSTSTIGLRFKDTGCSSGYPDMRSTDFTVVFGTDQGVCSVDFST